MNNQLFLSLALLASVSSLGAMQQPVKEYKVKAVNFATMVATLVDGRTVNLDRQVRWNLDLNGVLSPIGSASVIPQALAVQAAPKAAIPVAPKAPVFKAAPKAAAMAVAAQNKACNGPACSKPAASVRNNGEQRRYIAKPMRFYCPCKQN